MKKLHEASTVEELVSILKAEQGDSNVTLAVKVGVSTATIHRILHGKRVDDETLDRIADYAGLTRAWVYELAKGIPARPRYSRYVSTLIALLEQAPADVQEAVLVMARALVEDRKKKQRAKEDQDVDEFVDS